MTGIEDLLGKEFGNNSSSSDDDTSSEKLTEDDEEFLRANGIRNAGGNGNVKGKGNDNKNGKSNVGRLEQQLKNEKRKKEIVAYKYSKKGKGRSLYEAIILAGKPVFVTYDYSRSGSGQIRIEEKIEEEDRIIKPPYREECPYECYEFANLDELQDFVKQAKSTSIGQLYLKAKELVLEYNDQDKHKLILIASDIVFSYFQDKFATTHYDSIVGDNDSGKSSLGITFEALGYRPVYMIDPSAANIFRCLGTIEPGQCTIILDEADKIDKSPEMMAILKTGYQLDGKVPKINTNTLRQEFFYTYALKIIIGERSMSLTEAKGVYDRTFSFTAYPGDSTFDIKETLNPQGNEKCQSRLAQIHSFRKLMLIYRLIHFGDLVEDIDTGLKRRNRELCKPMLQLFHDATDDIQNEIKPMLEHFLNVKKQRRGNAIEAALHPIITDLISGNGKELSVSEIWGMIIKDQEIGGYYDEKRPNEFQTSDYGTIHRNSITNIICDKLGAVKKHTERGSVLIFDPEKLMKIGAAYDIKTKIQLKLIEDDPDSSDGSDGSNGQADVFDTNENVNNANNIQQNKDNLDKIIINNENITIPNNAKESEHPIKPSEPSGSSAEPLPNTIENDRLQLKHDLRATIIHDDDPDVYREDDRIQSSNLSSISPSITSTLDIDNNTVENTDLKKFKCFYCDECFTSDTERANHIDEEHEGRLYYPTPEDFENRRIK